MFTYRDSQRPQFGNARPLGYLLNYFLVRPFHPLDELGIRLIPALAGTLAIPALYLLGRRLVGSRAALFAALLVTLNPTQILYSQLARYWSLVFLFCTIAPIALYLGVRDRNGRMFALGIVAPLILAGLSHPVGVLVGRGARRSSCCPASGASSWRQWWRHAGGHGSGPWCCWPCSRWRCTASCPCSAAGSRCTTGCPATGSSCCRPQAPPGVKQLVRLTGH